MSGRSSSIWKTVPHMFLIAVIIASMTLLCACTKEEAADTGNKTEESAAAGDSGKASEESSASPDSGEGTADSEEEAGDSLHAADPMTQEEMEADDSDGCIEDSEDLLY